MRLSKVRNSKKKRLLSWIGCGGWIAKASILFEIRLFLLAIYQKSCQFMGQTNLKAKNGFAQCEELFDSEMIGLCSFCIGFFADLQQAAMMQVIYDFSLAHGFDVCDKMNSNLLLPSFPTHFFRKN